MFGDNSYIYNTYSAAGEKLTTQYAIQALPVLSPLSGNGGTMETHPAAGTEDVTGRGLLISQLVQHQLNH